MPNVGKIIRQSNFMYQSDNSEIPLESRPPCLPRPWASIILNPIELLQTKDLLPSDHQKFEKILLYEVRLEQS